MYGLEQVLNNGLQVGPSIGPAVPLAAFQSRSPKNGLSYRPAERPPTRSPTQNDQGSHKQTDKPWKGNPEKEQRNDNAKIDLEKWHETNTH